MSNDFEAPSAPVERTITAAGRTGTFLFTEPSDEVATRLFAGIPAADDSEAQVKFRAHQGAVIAAIVSDTDGSPITVERVRKMRPAAVNALYKAAMETIGTDKDVDDAGKG